LQYKPLPSLGFDPRISHTTVRPDTDSRKPHSIHCIPRPLLDDTVAGLLGTGACSAERTLLAGDAATSSNSSTDTDGFRTDTRSSTTAPSTLYIDRQMDRARFKVPPNTL